MNSKTVCYVYSKIVDLMALYIRSVLGSDRGGWFRGLTTPKNSLVTGARDIQDANKNGYVGCEGRRRSREKRKLLTCPPLSCTHFIVF